MKLTDIDLSSLADVAGALTLLESVHQRLATGGVPLPDIEPGVLRSGREGVETFVPAPAGREYVVNPAPTLPNPLLSNPTADPEKLWGLGTKVMESALTADAEKLRGLGVDPMSGQPLPGTLDAASIFGGAPAQSAAPLPQSAPSTADVAPSPTALAALPGFGPTSPASSGLTALAPLPVASAAAPAAPAHQASPAGGVELDADGLPWDARIHAGTKRRNADGRWTAKKGINDPDLVPRVVAQLRAQTAAGGVTTLTQLQAGISQPATAPAPHVTAAPVDALQALAGVPAPAVTLAPIQLMATIAGTPVPPALPGAKPVPLTFQDFMTAMTVEVMSGRVPATALLEACKPYGGTTALAANPAPIPDIWKALKDQYQGML